MRWFEIKGSIDIHSTLDEGTEFQIYFPAAHSTNHIWNAPSIDTEKALDNLTVLLVEDEESIRGITKRMLESNGHQVLDYESAEAVIGNLENIELIDLLVADINLSDLNGVELYIILKKKFENLKVLFMSGYVGKSLESFSRLPSNTTYLPKPFSRDLLQRKIIEALQ